MFLPIEAREKIIAALTGKDTALVDIARLQARLREAASLIPDFPVYQSLCSDTIRMAWESDRTTGKRTTHNLKMSWLRLFPYFASGQRLSADLRIRALNRAGDTYACSCQRKIAGRNGRGLLKREKCLVFIRTSWSISQNITMHCMQLIDTEELL